MAEIIKRIVDKYDIGEALIELTAEKITALYKNGNIVPCKHSNFNAIPDGNIMINGQPKVKIVRTACGSWCGDFSVREHYDPDKKEVVHKEVLVCSGRLHPIPLVQEEKKKETGMHLSK